MHTVFGPAVDTLRQQNVIFTRTSASGELAREFESIFYKYGAKITYTTPEHHDKQMAFHQETWNILRRLSWRRYYGRISVTRQSWESYSSPTHARH